jgi:hypothetical protein
MRKNLYNLYNQYDNYENFYLLKKFMIQNNKILIRFYIFILYIFIIC